MKSKIPKSSSWINEVLVNIIRRELAKGKSGEEIKNWLISYGFKPLDFKREFKLLAPEIEKSIKNLKAGQNKPEKTKKKINLKPAIVILAAAICLIFIFQYSKEISGFSGRFLTFTKSKTYDKIFKKNIPRVAVENNTEAPAPAPTSSDATSSESMAMAETSTVPTTIAGTTTDPENSTENLAVTTTTLEAPESQSSAPDNNEVFLSAIEQSKNLWNSGRHNESLKTAQTALEKAQNDGEKARAQYWIGISYYSQGKKAEAEKAELLAISLDPYYEPPYVTLSAIKLDQNECNQAFEYAQKARELIQDDVWNLNNLGLAYLCLGDKENAIIHLQKALSLAPHSNIIRSNLEIAVQIIY